MGRPGTVAAGTGGGTGLLVNGEWATGAAPLSVVDKYSGSVIAELAVPGPDQVDAALESAAAEAGLDFPVIDRAAVLRRAARYLASRRDEIVADYVAETGFTPGDGITELAPPATTPTPCPTAASRTAARAFPAPGTR